MGRDGLEPPIPFGDGFTARWITILRTYPKTKKVFLLFNCQRKKILENQEHWECKQNTKICQQKKNKKKNQN